MLAARRCVPYARAHTHAQTRTDTHGSHARIRPAPCVGDQKKTGPLKHTPSCLLGTTLRGSRVGHASACCATRKCLNTTSAHTMASASLANRSHSCSWSGTFALVLVLVRAVAKRTAKQRCWRCVLVYLLSCPFKVRSSRRRRAPNACLLHSTPASYVPQFGAAAN